MTAAVNSEVVAEPERKREGGFPYSAHGSSALKQMNGLPPMSAVRTLPALMTSNVALAMLFAR